MRGSDLGKKSAILALRRCRKSESTPDYAMTTAKA